MDMALVKSPSTLSEAVAPGSFQLSPIVISKVAEPFKDISGAISSRLDEGHVPQTGLKLSDHELAFKLNLQGSSANCDTHQLDKS